MASSSGYLAYIRVSTAKQGEQGVSLFEQRDAIVRYAEKHGLTIQEWFEERETAAKQGRPVFSAMLRLLQSSKAAGLIIHKVDRSARNLRDWADIGDLIDSGVDVRFAHESLDMQSRSGRLAADVQAVFAANFIRNNRDECRKGIIGRLKQGLYPRPAPLGYLDGGKGRPKIPDPVKAPLVRAAFDLYATGRFTLETLATELQRRGLRNSRNKPLSINAVSELLNNPFHAGVIRIQRTGATYPGIHEPLISPALFARVQQLLKGKATTGPWKHDYLFRRTLRCRHCHQALIGERQKGRIYYRCHTKGCITKTVREDDVDAAIAEAMNAVQLADADAKMADERLAVMESKTAETAKSEQQTASLQLAAVKDRLNRLTDAYLDGVIDRQQLDQRKETLLLEQKGLETRLHEIQSGAGSLMEQLRNVLELAKSAWLTYKTLPASMKREMLRVLTSNRIVDGKNVLVELREDFAVLAGGLKLMCGAPHRDNARMWDEVLAELQRVLSQHPDMAVPLHLRAPSDSRSSSVHDTTNPANRQRSASRRRATAGMRSGQRSAKNVISTG